MKTSSKKTMYNADPYKGICLDLSLGHFPVGYKKSRKNFALCSASKHKIECSICGVILCCADDDEGSCFKDWHTHDTL